MKRLLVAVGQSGNAERLVEYAVGLATITGGTVSLCHVVSIRPLMPPSGELAPVPIPRSDLVQRAETFMHRLREAIPPSLRGDTFVELGVPASRVCEVARTCDATLLVIGAHEHGLIFRMLGTNAARIVNGADRPVLVVRFTSSRSGAARPSQRLSRIVVAVDDSDAAELVREVGGALAQSSGAKLRLIRAAVLPADVSAAEPALARHEERVPVELRAGHWVYEGGSAADAICEEARRFDADLVIIGAHRYGLGERILGTTAAKVVNRIDRPTLVVRPVQQAMRALRQEPSRVPSGRVA